MAWVLRTHDLAPSTKPAAWMVAPSQASSPQVGAVSSRLKPRNPDAFHGVSTIAGWPVAHPHTTGHRVLTTCSLSPTLIDRDLIESHQIFSKNPIRISRVL
ncbi:hypothetical protein ACFX2C_012663 [Malus domestica]